MGSGHVRAVDLDRHPAQQDAVAQHQHRGDRRPAPTTQPRRSSAYVSAATRAAGASSAKPASAPPGAAGSTSVICVRGLNVRHCSALTAALELLDPVAPRARVQPCVVAVRRQPQAGRIRQRLEVVQLGVREVPVAQSRLHHPQADVGVLVVALDVAPVEAAHRVVQLARDHHARSRDDRHDAGHVRIGKVAVQPLEVVRVLPHRLALGAMEVDAGVLDRVVLVEELGPSAPMPS